MSRGPENNFISGVHRHLPAGLYRMKNHNAYNAGIADVWYDGVQDLWVEYKFIQIPKRADTLIDLVGGKNPSLSALQQKWLKDRHANGRQVGVIVGSADGGVWMPGDSWDTQFTAKQFRDHLLTRAELAAQIVNLTVNLTGGTM